MLDIGRKQGKFIGKVNSILQELHFSSPEVLIKVIDSQATSFFGSPLWSLTSQDVERIYKSWNVMLRRVFQLDRCTHRYLLEGLTNTGHILPKLTAKTQAFYESLEDSPKPGIRFLYSLSQGDNRTTTGQNTDTIMKSCIGIPSKTNIKRSAKYALTPVEESWRVSISKELHVSRYDVGDLQIEGFSRQEIETMLKDICIS